MIGFTLSGRGFAEGHRRSDGWAYITGAGSPPTALEHDNDVIGVIDKRLGPATCPDLEQALAPTPTGLSSSTMTNPLPVWGRRPAPAPPPSGKSGPRTPLWSRAHYG
ncbi:hypothetical protein FAGKG844_270042 [Frankia sp. AgKG'84/4]